MEKKERKILEKNISRISVIDENDTNCKFCNELFTQNDGKIEYNGKIFCSENCNKLFSRNKKPVDFMKTIGINLRFLNAEMKKMKPQIQTICNNYFSEKMENILITGKETGVGKTFLAIAILRQYALTFPKNCFFINCTDLFIEIKNSFTNRQNLLSLKLLKNIQIMIFLSSMILVQKKYLNGLYQSSTQF